MSQVKNTKIVIKQIGFNMVIMDNYHNHFDKRHMFLIFSPIIVLLMVYYPKLQQTLSDTFD